MSARLDQKKLESGELRYRLLPSVRLLVVLVAGLGMGLVMVARYNVSMAMVCMVDSNPRGVHSQPVKDDASNGLKSVMLNRTWIVSGNRSSNHFAGWRDDTNNLAEQPQGHHAARGEFQWDKTFQGLLLSSYFYGYTAGLIPGGWVSDRLPANAVLTFGVGSQGLFVLLFPFVARVNSYLLLALRALQGFCCSVVLPVSTVLIRNWSVPEEFSTLFSITFSLSYLFNGLTFPISSSLCQLGGWPMVFYVTGALPLVWVILAWFVVPSCPDESALCSEEERRYIISQRQCQAVSFKSFKSSFKPSTAASSETGPKSDVSTPFLAIVFNRQVLIILASFFSFGWFFFSLNITMPTFLEETMQLDLAENGLLSGLPTMSMTVGCVFGGKLFQHLLTSWSMTRTRARKLISTISLLAPAAMLSTILVLPPGSKFLTIFLLTASNFVGVLFVSGGPLSAGPEIGPQYAGIIWGIAGSAGNMSGFLSPTLAAVMTPHKTLAEWRLFFLVSVVLLVAADVLILLFWRSEVQQFARRGEARSVEARKVDGANV